MVDTSDLDSDTFSVKVQVLSQVPYYLGLAQLGRASGLGPEGRTFKSFIRDQICGRLAEWFIATVLKTVGSE